jgi:hypothetical protein
MVVVIHGTNGIVAPGLTSEDSTGTTTLTTTSLTLGGTLVTSTATELNVLDGIPGTLTATELGYVDGVTSSIQTQLNSATSDIAAITLTPQVISADTTATAGNFYYLDSAGITLTLPASPSSGDQIGIADVAGDNTHIIAANGNNIMSDSADLTWDIAYKNNVIVYTGASLGWAFSG